MYIYVCVWVVKQIKKAILKKKKKTGCFDTASYTLADTHSFCTDTSTCLLP